MAARGFSHAAIEVAGVIGAAAPLSELAALETRGTRAATAELRALRLRQAVVDRIMLAMLDVSGTLAAIDCEGERGDQLRVRLQGIESRRARRLGLASIMVGALTAALSGGLSAAGAGAAGNAVGIAGGAAEASAGTSLLFGSASGELRTERNLLRDVWERPARSDLFPPSVWRFLTRRPGGDEGRATVAEVVVAEWRAAELLGRGDPEEERSRAALLFGAGGTYTVEELEARDAMLDLLEASVALMSRDLRTLLEELLDRQANGPPRAEDHGMTGGDVAQGRAMRAKRPPRSSTRPAAFAARGAAGGNHAIERPAGAPSGPPPLLPPNNARSKLGSGRSRPRHTGRVAARSKGGFPARGASVAAPWMGPGPRPRTPA